MVSVDQPLKRRKLCVPPSIFPPSQDEILRRRRNREEIRNLYDCYRRIRFCVSHKDAHLMPDLEQSYLSLITASRGCTSVQRIVAELIPRYASFCPTALEAAVKVSINMYTWSIAIIMRGEDGDSVAYQTAKACIFGLVDICCTASREAPTSSVISGICSAVFQNVLTFFTSTFEGKDIYQVSSREIQKLQESAESFCDLKEELEDDNEHPLHKLFKFRALSLFCVFFCFPKNLLAACFELLVASGSDSSHRKNVAVRYFLKQLTSHLNANEVTHSLNKITDGIPPCTDSAQCDTVCKGSEEVNPVSNENSGQEKLLFSSTNCLIKVALHREPSLRGWILRRYKKLCESFSPEHISEISSFLEKIFGSLSDAVLEAGSEERSEGPLDPLECASTSHTSYQVPTQHSDNADAFSMAHSIDVQDSSINGALLKHVDAAKMDAGQNLKPHSSLLSNLIDTHSGVGSLTHEGGRSASLKNLEIGNLEGSCAKQPSPKNMTNNRFIPSDIRRQSDVRNDPHMRSHAIELAKIQSSNIDLGLPEKVSPSSCAPNIFPSPRLYSIAWHHASYNQNFWYSDGDPAAMDVFSASNQLWLGSLGHDASEMVIQMQFEDFGLLTQFVFVPAKDFALIEYRNILDAVRAREYMQGSSPWGSSLQIKFVDRGLGSRGVVSNIAVGDSCYIYIGKVSNQKEKDDILHELIILGTRKPRITDLTIESALLLEFGSAEEATSAMSHIRHVRKDTWCRAHPDRNLTLNTSSNDKSVSNCQLLVRQIDASVSDEELINAFSRYGELTRWKFNRSACYCYIDFRSPEAAYQAKSNLHGARIGATSIVVEFRADNFGTVANHMVFSSPGPFLHDSSIGTSTPRNMNASGYFQSQRDLHHTGMESKPPNSYSSSFAYKPEGSIHDLVSPRLKMEKLATHVHNAQPFQTNWPTTTSSEMLEAGSRNFDDYGRSSDPSLAGPVTPREQVWQYKHQEIEPQMFACGTQPCPAPGGSMIPPPIQAPSFVRPVYLNPSNSWDNAAQNSSIPNQIPTGMTQTDNHHFNPHPVVPFIPSSVTPVSQLPGGSIQRYDQLASVPSLPSPIPPPPPLDAPPSLPSSPPPLPQSLPPSVPPPPSSPPPQSGTGSSSLQLGEPHMHYQWRGTLSKSGVHYCTIYATHEDSAACRYSNAVSEPVDWPGILDVTKRTDIRHVKTTFATTRLHRRGVCRLLPSAASDHKGFQDFISYLKQRECAGVIKIPGGKSLWARLLFILPHSHDTCCLLGISPYPADCLIALVLPKDASTDAV